MNLKTSEFNHITVLRQECIDSLEIVPGDTCIDCTAGGGGHTELLLAAAGEQGRVVAIDQDQTAIGHLKTRFDDEVSRQRLLLYQGSFENLGTSLFPVPKANRILADLGVSSPQLDCAERGFSFMRNGPLDMRMDQDNNPLTAEELLRESSHQELYEMFRDFGEEPKAWHIAGAIVEARVATPFVNTSQLAEFVQSKIRYKTRSRTHPATRVFQALRIAVNRELEVIETMLDRALEMLEPGGRLAVITFHSLEDRIVKKKMQLWSGKSTERSKVERDLSRLPLTQQELDRGKPPVFGKVVKPFPLSAPPAECERNPRARSAKLRVFEKST